MVNKTEEKKKDDLVSLEMTQAQKEKVAKFLLMEEDKAKEEKEQATVTLKFAHWRNGVQYGPGSVKVSAPLASSLAVADDRAYEMRINENQESSHIIKILGRGHTQIVKGN